MDRVLLIDADGFLYKNEEDLGVYKDRIDEIISALVEETDSSHYKVFLEAPNRSNFRRQLIKSYKGQRKKEKPHNFVEIRDYLISNYNAYLSYFVETDDSIISTHRYLTEEYPLTDIVIATPDKDFKTKEVTIYDTYHGRYGEIYEISKDESDYNFYTQMLVGDGADNVKGCKGVGKKGAEKILDNTSNYFVASYRKYVSVFGEDSRAEWEKNKFLLTLRDDARPCTDFNEVVFYD